LWSYSALLSHADGRVRKYSLTWIVENVGNVDDNGEKCGVRDITQDIYFRIAFVFRCIAIIIIIVIITVFL
jgi:hypothetical protein